MSTTLPSPSFAPPAVDERPTDAATRAALDELLARVDRLTRAVERVEALADRAPAAVAMAVDIADDVMRESQDAGIDVERGLLQGLGAAVRFGAMMGPAQVASIEAVLRSGVLDPPVVDVVGHVGTALAAASAEPPRPVGPLGVLRALADPDVQRALGLLLRFASAFGRQLAPRT